MRIGVSIPSCGTVIESPPPSATFRQSHNPSSDDQAGEFENGAIAESRLKKLPLGKAIAAAGNHPKTISGLIASGLRIHVKHTKPIDVLTVTSGSPSHDRSAATLIERSWRWSEATCRVVSAYAQSFAAFENYYPFLIIRGDTINLLVNV